MIHSFQELRDLYQKGVEHRYVGATIAIDDELDSDDEMYPRDAYLAAATPDDLMGLLDAAPGESGVDPAPANDASPPEEPDRDLDYDLSPGDITKLKDSGVRIRDAVDACLTHVTSNEAAYHLNRTDIGAFEGIFIPYGHLGAGVSHCRVLLETPVKLKTSKGRLVHILQPVASTNHLYYVPGTTPGVLVDTSVPVVFCDSECGALAARQLRKDDQPPILPVGIGGAWGWRKSRVFDDPDGGETKVEKGPVADLGEKIAQEGRRVIIAFASDAATEKDVKSARAALVKFFKKQKALVSVLEVPEA